MNQKLLTKIRDRKVQGIDDASIKTEFSKNYPLEEIDKCLAALAYVNPHKVEVSEQLPVRQRLFSKQHNTISSDGSFLAQLTGYAIGLAGVLFVSIILGVLINEGLVSHYNDYFGNFNDAVSYFLFLPVTTIIFGIIAVGTGKRILWAFPVLAFYVSAYFYDSSVVPLFAGYLPFEHSNKLEYFIAVVLGYTFLYSIIIPLLNLISASRGSSIIGSNYTVAAQTIILGIGIFLWLIIGIFSPGLNENRQRVRSAVHVPMKDNLFSSVISEYQLHYQISEDTNNPKYLSPDDINVTQVKKWWVRDTQSNCGATYGNQTSKEKTAKYNYASTKSGIEYGTAELTYAASNVPLPTNTYRMQNYCFVIGYQIYSIDRQDHVIGISKNVPDIEKVIDTIVAAETYYPVCNTEKRLPKFCKPKDKDRIKELHNRFLELHNPKSDQEFIAPGVKSPKLNRAAYNSVGTLQIKEWGVSLPLTEDMKDAYYYPTKFTGRILFTFESMTIDLASLPGNQCKGLAMITRDKLSNLRTSDKNTFVEGTVIGDYVYSTTEALNAENCLPGSGRNITNEMMEDQFYWATANVTKN